ncbi:unnamed protein product [Rhodiola kirilowii]
MESNLSQNQRLIFLHVARTAMVKRCLHLQSTIIQYVYATVETSFAGVLMDKDKKERKMCRDARMHKWPAEQKGPCTTGQPLLPSASPSAIRPLPCAAFPRAAARMSALFNSHPIACPSPLRPDLHSASRAPPHAADRMSTRIHARMSDLSSSHPRSHTRPETLELAHLFPFIEQCEFHRDTKRRSKIEKLH